jgi:RimJ/RimL family protein N-acetyltransferase
MMSDAERASQANRRPINREPVDLAPVLRPRTKPLAGRRVTMEPIDPKAHAAGLFAATQEPGGDAIWNYLPYGPYPDEAAVVAWLRGCAASADPVFYAIRDNETGALGGMASLMEIRPLMGVIEVGHIWFSPHLQRTVQASEAIFTLMRHGMDDLGNRRLEWKCNALNAGSRNAVLRFGFRYEGTFYAHLITKGVNRDTAWFSITAEEWPAVRAAHERWLDPSNFDAEGGQKSSLSGLTRALW